MHTPRVGRKYGRLTVLEIAQRSPRGDSNHVYLCKCDCGNLKKAKWENLARGSTKSCGCLKASLARPPKPQKPPRNHGHSKHPLFNTWRNMMRRCYDPTRSKYKHYGAKGITVCDRWHDFTSFVADVGEKPSEKHTLDRIDPAGPYSPENVRWADQETQANNRRDGRVTPYLTIRGVRKSVAVWAKKFGVDMDKVRRDIKEGTPPLVALLSAVARKASWEAGKRTAADWEACYRSAVDKAAELESS